MIRFFTWHEIEILFEEKRLSWPKAWDDVKVYSDCVVIYYNSSEHDIEESCKYLKELFTRNYDVKEKKILVDFSGVYLDVFFEESEEYSRKGRQYAPLFKEVYFSTEKLQSESEKLPGARILAFHSYKGGVGRTLSLISLLRECSSHYPEKKILVIDSDLEAPGLTWMLAEQGQRPISYLDILSVMNFDEDIDQAIKRMAAEIQTSLVTVETDKMKIEQLFVPAYRHKKQVMNIFSNSERVLISKDNKYWC